MHDIVIVNGRSLCEDLEEKINIARADIVVKRTAFDVLPDKERRVSLLSDISGKLTNLVDVNEINNFLLQTISSLFPSAQMVLIFDFKDTRDKLQLRASCHSKGVNIRQKHGDIIDMWVVRNNQSVLVDDISKDFRFDFHKVEAYIQRKTSSFMVSPVSIGDKLLGVIRVESMHHGAFTQDDFRIFRNICDLAAVVLERAALFSDIEELAIVDPLTSLFLRDYFFTRLKEELVRAEANGTKVGLIMVDIDNFKNINDTYGHTVGDLILKRSSKVFSRLVCGEGNVACRFGGEEFIAFIIESDYETLKKISNDICSTMAATQVAFRRKHINFTVSGGAVVYPDDGRDALALIDQVDQLLYQAKREGKNKFCFLK